MRRPVAALAAALALASAVLAGPSGWDPAEPPRPWRPGERRRLATTESVEVTTTERVEGAEPRVTRRTSTLEARALLTVAEVSSAGAVVAWRVDVEAWSRAEGGGPADASLAGRTAAVRLDEVDEEDDEGPPLQPASPAPSPAARGWLKRLAGWLRAPAPLDRALTPPRPVAAGEAWEARGAEALVEGHPFTGLDPGRSQARATLVRAGAEELEARLEARLQTRVVPGTTARVAEGGVYALEVTARWPRGGRPALGAWREKVTYEAVGADRLPDAATPRRLEVKVAAQRSGTVDEVR